MYDEFTERINCHSATAHFPPPALYVRVCVGSSLPLSLSGGFKRGARGERGGGEHFSTWRPQPRLLFVQTVRFSSCLSSLPFCQTLTLSLACMCGYKAEENTNAVRTYSYSLCYLPITWKQVIIHTLVPATVILHSGLSVFAIRQPCVELVPGV